MTFHVGNLKFALIAACDYHQIINEIDEKEPCFSDNKSLFLSTEQLQ
jgi:hypothetical protein